MVTLTTAAEACCAEISAVAASIAIVTFFNACIVFLLSKLTTNYTLCCCCISGSEFALAQRAQVLHQILDFFIAQCSFPGRHQDGLADGRTAFLDALERRVIR